MSPGAAATSAGVGRLTDRPAGLAHQQLARRAVPRVEAGLEVAVDAARRRPSARSSAAEPKRRTSRTAGSTRGRQPRLRARAPRRGS